MNSDNVIFIGIGNTLRGDDGAGAICAQRLKGKINIIEAATTPENYLSKIIKENPSEVWIIDCLDFGASPGQWKIFKSGELSSDHMFFTHNLSLELFCDYLRNNIAAPIFILGIQPKSTRLSENLSKEVEATLGEIEAKLIEVAKSRRD